MMKTQTPSGASNPLSRIALEAPAALGPAISIGARVIGAALALYIAQGQSYDRTQMFAAGLAADALLSIVPLPRGISPGRVFGGGFVSALGAGALFFGGAVLAGETPAAGITMLIAGAAAACGALMAGRRTEQTLAVALIGFFASLPALIAAVALIALAVEG